MSKPLLLVPLVLAAATWAGVTFRGAEIPASTGEGPESREASARKLPDLTMDARAPAAGSSLTAVQYVEEATCADGQEPGVLVRLDSGETLRLPPDLLIGNGLEEMLQDPVYRCGERGILMSAIRIPLLYQTAFGGLPGGDWGEATPPNLALAATYGAGLLYQSDRGKFDGYKIGLPRRDRRPAFCTLEPNGFEYCSTCPEDPGRRGYCIDGDFAIKDWHFYILDRRENGDDPPEEPLILRCHGTQYSELRNCEGRYGTGTGLYVIYRFSIRAGTDVFTFDFGGYNDRIEAYLKQIMLP
jgi:hypothetical protein